MSKRVGLRHMQSIVVGKKPLADPAFNYDNLVGTIWMEDPGHSGYDIRSGGSVPIEVRDPYGTSPAGDLNGGSYDNR
jgi:hypothetical protein